MLYFTHKDGNTRELKLMAKKLNDYGKSMLYGLYDCYNKPSQAKKDAYYDIKTNLYLSCAFVQAIRILSYNSMAFTIGAVVKPELNSEYYFVYITKDNIRYIPLRLIEDIEV